MEAYLGMISAFGFNFAPQGWAMCQGQLMAIAQNQALFALLGTMYGGDGRQTFGLPDLRGRSAIGAGQGPGLSPWYQGEKRGEEMVTLMSNQMPAHSHTAAFQPPSCETHVQVSTSNGAADTPTSGNYMAKVMNGANALPQFVNDRQKGTLVSLNGVTSTLSGGSVALSTAGGSQPFSVVNPRLALNYCIALVGIFPSRND